MNKYLVTYKDTDDVYIDADRFDLENLVTVKEDSYVPFYAEDKIVSIAKTCGIASITIYRWNINRS